MRYIRSTWTFIRSRSGVTAFTAVLLAVQFCLLLCLLGWSMQKQKDNGVYESPCYILNTNEISSEQAGELLKITREISPHIDSMIAGYIVNIPVRTDATYQVAITTSQDIDEDNVYNEHMILRKNWLISYFPQQMSYHYSPSESQNISVRDSSVIDVKIQDEQYTFEVPYDQLNEKGLPEYRYPRAMQYFLTAFPSADTNALASEETFFNMYSTSRRRIGIIITTTSELTREEKARLDRVAYEYGGGKWEPKKDPAIKKYEDERITILLEVMLLYLVAFRIVVYTIELRKKEFEVYVFCGEKLGSIFLHIISQVLVYLAIAVVLGSGMFLLVRRVLGWLQLRINYAMPLNITMTLPKWSRYTGMYILLAMGWLVLYYAVMTLVNGGSIWKRSSK